MYALWLHCIIGPLLHTWLLPDVNSILCSYTCMASPAAGHADADYICPQIMRKYIHIHAYRCARGIMKHAGHMPWRTRSISRHLP